MQWSVVHAWFRHGKAVERNIVERINRAGMQSKFGRFLSQPKRLEQNGQKKKPPELRFFLAKVLAHLSRTSWHLVKHTNKVIGCRWRQESSGATSGGRRSKIVDQMQVGIEKPHTRLSSKPVNMPELSDWSFHRPAR
jgi:transcriptional antiterminator NusG